MVSKVTNSMQLPSSDKFVSVEHRVLANTAKTPRTSTASLCTIYQVPDFMDKLKAQGSDVMLFLKEKFPERFPKQLHS